jgi:hypothetical protein
MIWNLQALFNVSSGMKTLAPLFCLCFSVLLQAQTLAPDRTVSGHVLTSTHDPAVRVRLPEPVQYIGADRWVLYDIADCELHAFVEADAQKNVKRLYWIQFEGYLPSKPDLHHTYDSPRHVSIGRLDFFVDTWVHKNGAPTRQGSDREHIEALIRAKGFRMPAATMDVRLVHLLDAEQRQELMVIYAEDLSSTGFSAPDISEGGKAHRQWAGVEKGLIERAQRTVVIEPLSSR